MSDVIRRQDLVEADLCCLMCGRMVGRLVGFGRRDAAADRPTRSMLRLTAFQPLGPDQPSVQRLLETVPHTKVRRIVPPLPGPNPVAIDFASLGGTFSYMTFIRQVDFLEFMAEAAGQYPASN